MKVKMLFHRFNKLIQRKRPVWIKIKATTLCFLILISKQMISFRREFDTTSVLTQQNAAMMMITHLQQYLSKGIRHPY